MSITEGYIACRSVDDKFSISSMDIIKTLGEIFNELIDRIQKLILPLFESKPSIKKPLSDREIIQQLFYERNNITSIKNADELPERSVLKRLKSATSDTQYIENAIRQLDKLESSEKAQIVLKQNFQGTDLESTMTTTTTTMYTLVEQIVNDASNSIEQTDEETDSESTKKSLSFVEKIQVLNDLYQIPNMKLAKKEDLPERDILVAIQLDAIKNDGSWYQVVNRALDRLNQLQGKVEISNKIHIVPSKSLPDQQSTTTTTTTTTVVNNPFKDRSLRSLFENRQKFEWYFRKFSGSQEQKIATIKTASLTELPREKELIELQDSLSDIPSFQQIIRSALMRIYQLELESHQEGSEIYKQTQNLLAEVKKSYDQRILKDMRNWFESDRNTPEAIAKMKTASADKLPNRETLLMMFENLAEAEKLSSPEKMCLGDIILMCLERLDELEKQDI